jgi:hypothetical protein
MPVFTSTLVSESTRGLTTFHHDRLEERNGCERCGHTLDQVDGVLPSRPFQDVAVGGLADLASASHRQVEPSMSVNKNVTTPEGAAARSADTPAESHNRHAPTWHSAGIRPRRVTNTHSTAARIVPRQQHVVVEHAYRPVDEPDPVGHGGDPECAHCLGIGSDYRRCDPDHQAVDETGTASAAARTAGRVNLGPSVTQGLSGSPWRRAHPASRTNPAPRTRPIPAPGRRQRCSNRAGPFPADVNVFGAAVG